ncbi:MAG: hypothetical protein EP336_09500 [Rhodobacteraceae bacterium]|nr:MAG: hypothetical protein EP336_09500 [Paracoccaceae bacterium]
MTMPYLNVTKAVLANANKVKVRALLLDVPAQSQEQLLARWRAEASLSRAKFCIALRAVGLLSDTSAIEAAKGVWPEAFSYALAEIGMDIIEAQIIWGAATIIMRNDPLLEAMRIQVGLTEEQVDAMFGWTQPQQQEGTENV